MERKKVVVLFSGGLDSTYLIWDNLKRGNKVLPIYIDIGNNDVKTKIEKNRIKLLYDLFFDEFNELIETPIDVLKLTILYSLNDDLLFKQLPIWLLSILFVQDKYIDEIQIGYVSNDDIVPFVNDINKIYKSYKSILNNPTPLKFPLLKKTKYQIANELPEKYMDLIVSCENPKIENSDNNDNIIKYKPCCCCEPCKRIMITGFYGKHIFPDNYGIEIINNHIDLLNNNGYKVYDGNDVRCRFDTMPFVKEHVKQLKIPFDYNDDVKIDKEVLIDNNVKKITYE